MAKNKKRFQEESYSTVQADEVEASEVTQAPEVKEVEVTIPADAKEVQVQVKKATQSIRVVNSIEDIKSLLEDETKTGKEKIQILSESSLKELVFVKQLINYNNQMGKDVTAPTDVNGSNNNRSLFITLRQILDEVDYNLFKIQFDIVNLVFLEYADDAFSEFRLHRYDMKWSGTYKQLKTYQKLVTVIATLCDKTTRAEKLKSISLSKMIDAETTTFTDTNRSSILRYYSIA